MEWSKRSWLTSSLSWFLPMENFNWNLSLQTNYWTWRTRVYWVWQQVWNSCTWCRYLKSRCEAHLTPKHETISLIRKLALVKTAVTICWLWDNKSLLDNWLIFVDPFDVQNLPSCRSFSHSCPRIRNQNLVTTILNILTSTSIKCTYLPRMKALHRMEGQFW